MIYLILITALVFVAIIWSGSIYLYVRVSKASMPKKQRVLHCLAIFIKGILFEGYPENTGDPEIRKEEITKYNKKVRDILSGYYVATIGLLIVCFLTIYISEIILTLYMFLIILPLVLLYLLYINMFLFVSLQVEFDSNMKLKPIQLLWIDKKLIHKDSQEYL